jgi:hypothetical protein
MLGRKLKRLGITRAFVLGGIIALGLVTALGLTPALAKHNHGNHGHGNHGNHGNHGSDGGGGEGGGGGGQFDLTSFSGRYTTSYHGFDSSITPVQPDEPNPPAVPFAVSGSITSDGNGNVTGGTLQTDYGSPGTGAAATCSETGTYTVSSDGQVTLNLNSSCTAVTCSLDGSGNPTCAPSGSPSSTPTQWFCSLSDTNGKRMVCTEMGEATSGTTFQTPISAVTWAKGRAPAPPPSDDNDGDNDNGGDD